MYYDVHTHRESPPTPDTRSIINLPVGKDNLFPGDHPSSLYSAGIHPWDIGSYESVQQAVDTLLPVLNHKNVVAVGECGLDGCIDVPVESQIDLFRQMASLSEGLGKPLILHVVRTFNDIMNLRRELRPSQPWIIHGFRGKPELARQLQQSGFFLSLGEHFNPDIFRMLSPDRLLLETDESDMDIADIYKRVANVSGIEIESLKEVIARNLQIIFRSDIVVN